MMKARSTSRFSLPKVEVVNFYEQLPDKNNCIGTMHFFLCDIGVDLRGVAVFNRKNRYFFRIPIKVERKENNAQYPIFSYRDKKKNQDLVKAMRFAGIEFIEKKKAMKE